MSAPEFSAALGSGAWEKALKAVDKSKFPKPDGGKLTDGLKALGKAYLRVDWKSVDLADPKAAAETAEEAEALVRKLQALEGNEAKALRGSALEAAKAFNAYVVDAGRVTSFPDAPVEQAKKIAKAADALAVAVADFLKETKEELADAVKALPREKDRAKPKDGAAAATGAAALKLVKPRVFDALRKIRANKPGTAPTRFVIAQGKTLAAVYLGPSVGPAQQKLLTALLPGEAPIKFFKDAAGEAKWEQKSLTLVSDVLPPGLVKRMQLWLKQTLKLNIKVRVRKTTGETEEGEDADDLGDEALKLDAKETEEALQEAAAAVGARLAALMPQLRDARARGGETKKKIEQAIAALGKARDERKFDDAELLLDGLEALVAAPAVDVEALLRDWQAERSEAMAALKVIANQIKTSRHASLKEALAELAQVGKQLVERPANKAEVSALRKYLASDDTVADICEMARDIRSPLNDALVALEAQLPG